MTKTEKQFAAMEEMLAHHEQTIDQLCDQLANQWKIIAEMENKLLVLTRRFVILEQNSSPIPHVSKPPHY